MRKIIQTTALTLGLILTQSCQSDTTFVIAEDSVGPLKQSTPVTDLETVFAQDSIVRESETAKKIEIFEKGGKHLLSLTANTDSIPTIENVRIMDARYKSEKGINLLSTFKDIEDKYGIKKIVTTLNSIVVFPKGSNLYFTIDKAELPDNLRYSTSTIEAVQVPDSAELKYLMLGWE
ncbi:hypothetical protein [Flagellimonas zhangzhouensis]|uniref:Uncharacterized protein n=1 Tax=Flagellimonas zhangzhouensis TaxID=1073328 RepID=A0A1H2Q9Q1_9FLAO|nr:hypothetical protein [Allomuricauda zhangzhouensis]SDQ50283.1 hypothetical protein SAMN05216294_1478 [Allomuricauda zhangzhouensis]SDW03660.1 hypothetical protein SAMN04487892_0129 [Allomuricauda zhangzhouensis]